MRRRFLCLSLILISPAIGEEPQEVFTAGRFREHAAYLASDDLAGRAVGSEGNRSATEYIARRFQKYGLQPLGDDGTFFQCFEVGTLRARNVLAKWPGNGPLAEECVVVAAHHDHLGTLEGPVEDDTIFNGADDNASGVAAMLLVAEALAGARGVEEPIAPHRAVIFAAFDAEELGLLGAGHYAENPPLPLERTVAVLNFDMVGRLDRGKFYALEAESSPFLSSSLLDVGRDSGLAIETRIGGTARSDLAVFLDRRIPGVHFMTGIHADYHQVTDEIQTLDCEGGAKVASVAWRLLNKIQEHPNSIQFREIAPELDVGHALKLATKLGIIPRLNTQNGRYPEILAVVPGSLAAKYGLRKGDQITSFDGLAFDRVEDVLVLIPRLRFDDGFRLTILRAERLLEFEVPASEFADLRGPRIEALADNRFAVTFAYNPPPGTRTVYLAGSFNDWNPTGHAMDGPDHEGRFNTRLVLTPGTYEYKFVVDGKDWQSDPSNLHQVGFYENSVIWVGRSPGP